MDFLIYNIDYNNYEGDAIRVQIQDLDTYEDPPPNTIETVLNGSEFPVILDTPGVDEDKTDSIKGKRLRAGFNSTSTIDVVSFSDGSDKRFLVVLTCGGVAVPYLGYIVLDNNTEAFQPTPNPVTLASGDGFGLLKNTELKTTAGELPLGEYTIMDYIVMCLSNLEPNQEIHVVMNLYEQDTDPATSHTFLDIYLDALTFEKEINEREDCYTVLSKILDAFGCFITYDHDGWWIIRWDEYDAAGTSVTGLRTANFGPDGLMSGYTVSSVDKIIAHRADADFEGYQLSQDSAVRRFQRKAQEIKHIYKFNTPKEIVCNINFTRGTVIDDVLPLKTYTIECWDLRRGFGSGATTPNCSAEIWVRYDANDVEDERYAVLTTPSSEAAPLNYIRSQGLPVDEDDRIDIDFKFSADADNNVSGATTITVAAVILEGDDGSYWALQLQGSDETEWLQTNADFNTNTGVLQWQFDASAEDLTEWVNFTIASKQIPTTGKVYFHFFAANQTAGASDNFDIRYNDFNVTYRPYINATYASYEGHAQTVSQDIDARMIEKEMFIGDSPKRIFKGALLKFNGTDYVVTGTWTDYVTPFPLGLGDTLMSKWVLFAWWNQYRKTRTVIESDIQGMNTDTATGIPGLIHRWKIYHGDQNDKKFMLTSIRNMDFRTCGWQGVFVEMSDMDGDRDYSDTYEFKYISQ